MASRASASSASATGLATKAMRSKGMRSEVGLTRLARLTGLMLGGLEGSRWGDKAANGTRRYGTCATRLYDLSLDCRGGAGRALHRGATAGRLRQHPARHGVALLVAGRDRARRGGRDD